MLGRESGLVRKRRENLRTREENVSAKIRKTRRGWSICDGRYCAWMREGDTDERESIQVKKGTEIRRKDK